MSHARWQFPIPLTGGVEEAGLVAGVADPLFTVHGGVGQRCHFIPGGVPVVDVSDEGPLHRAARHLGALNTVMHYHRPGLVR